MEPKAIQHLPVDKIRCVPQVRKRFDDEKIIGLAQSIREVGLLQPLGVRRDGDRWIVNDGERRLRAAKLAGLTSVPVIFEDRELCAAEVIQRQLIANCQRENLRPLELANAIKRLMDESRWSASQVAVKLGLSPATICRTLSLLELDEGVRKRVEAGEIPASTAYEIGKVGDPAERAALATEAINGGLSRGGLIQRVKARRSQKGKRATRHGTRNAAQRIVLSLGDALSVVVAEPVPDLGTMISSIEGFLVRIRDLYAKGASFADIVRDFSSQTKQERK